MAANINRPEDEADTAVAFALPKDLAPYARELYDIRKRGAETLDEFACRLFCEEAVRHVMRVTLSAEDDSRRTAQLADQNALGLEMTALLDRSDG